MAAQRGLNGEIGTQEVVEATMALESTVKIAVAMRDKLRRSLPGSAADADLSGRRG